MSVRALERYLLPVLGHKAIGKLSAPDLARLAAELAERAATTTSPIGPFTGSSRRSERCSPPPSRRA